jgi:hypothetical protein
VIYATDTMRHDASTTPDGTLRLSVAEAADFLGISAEAVRQRTRRGTLPTERDATGAVVVLLDPDIADTTRTDTDTTRDATRTDTSRDEAMEILRDQVTFLQRELERKDALLLNMTEVMKALNPPQDSSRGARDGDLTASREQGDGDVPPSEAKQERRSWWARLLGV